jgi:hypothetical protein
MLLQKLIFAQEREKNFDLVYRQKNIYDTFSAQGHTVQGPSFSRKTTLNPLEIYALGGKFGPFCTSICRIFYTVSIAEFLAILGIYTKCVLIQA